MNDKSSWYHCTERDGKWLPEKFFIR
jgi:hypothetical protein